MGESKFSLWFSGGVTIVEVAYEVVYNALKLKKKCSQWSSSRPVVAPSYILPPIANGSPLGSCSPGQNMTNTFAEWIQFPGQSFLV